MKLTKEFWLSIIFGIAGLGLSLLRFNVVLENFRISLHWGFVLPLMIAIAYGPKYGLISGVLGLGAFFPFLLWPENGYANLLTVFLYALLYVYVGYISKVKRKKSRWWNHYFVIGCLYSFFLGTTIYFIYPILVGMNPPPWNPDASLTMSRAVALSIATKVSVEFFSGMMIALAFVKTNTLRKILGLPKQEKGRFNERVLGICLLFGLSFWLIYVTFVSIFVAQTFPYYIPFLNSPEEVVIVLVFLIVSFMASIVAMEYLEKQFSLNTEREKAEYELKQANLVVENSPAVLFRWKELENYPIIMVSANISQFGYCQEELVSRDITHADIVHPDDRERMKSEIENYTSNNIDRYQQQYRLLTKEGEVRWVDDLTTVIRGSDGGIVEYQGILLDVTERKRVEEALLESEARFKSVIAVSNTGVWEYHKDKNYLWCSHEYFTMLGKNPCEYAMDGSANISKVWTDLIHPDDQDRASACFADYLAGGSIGMYENHFRMQHSNGTWVWIWSRGQTIKNTKGSLSNLTVGTHINTTQLKEMEFKLFNEKEQFKATLLSIGDGVISTDTSGNVVMMNKVAEKLTGWTQEEAFSKSIEEVFYIVNEYTRERCVNPVKRALETGETVELTSHIILISKDGVERPIEDSAAPIKDERGNFTGVVLVFRDFTERKKSQDEIKYLSYHDHLTGLYNRRFFEVEMERLDTERNLPISIIMGDVNGLKLINDTFGHSVGDELLVKVSKILKNSFRGDDILARVGGDEIAVILPKTDDVKAQQLIKRLKRNFKNEQVKNIEISVAFGSATKVDTTQSLALVLKKAEDHMYNNKLFEGPSVQGKAIENIISTINAKSPREKVHSERVSQLCMSIGKALNLADEEINQLRVLGLFHDIGKIAIADDILNKPSKLTEKEYNEICRHAEIGYRILITVNGMSKMAEYVLHHHERWDGDGYPKGLKRDSIPLLARICTIADAYDAMTSDRSYRPARPMEYAVEELKKNAGTQFDPEIVSVFIKKVLLK